MMSRTAAVAVPWRGHSQAQGRRQMRASLFGALVVCRSSLCFNQHPRIPTPLYSPSHSLKPIRMTVKDHRM